ncbi:hypothetical protein QNI19_32795 [Cytophagaceae bacterium DM2B3-1]|uniref:SdpC family antimicrobial peptide n=1 Tax=Xanthocytophaga flava TaxID=3048013 RepID=A0ABT7CXS9_9BACT|nr:hypothetical protein [Xanthocytophaga flavus]MDJ1473277.1 hypothetical protein [Xanthocytophaga flavus]MDJ1497765.1 hypothetical protein [Xanthocytophaga flavus]
MINFIHKYVLKSYVIFPLLSIFIFASCSTSNAEEISRDYSGEELFKGIFFLQGDSASQLESLQPQLAKRKAMYATYPEMQKAYAEFSDEIISQIKKIEPSYFKQFKAQIQTKNLYKIQLALTNGAKMIKLGGLASEKYNGIFRLADQLDEKKVDLSTEDFKSLNTTKEEDMKKFKALLSEKYSINLDDEDYKVACTPPMAICVALLIGAVVAVTVAAVLLEVYAGAFLWGPSEGFGGSGTVGDAYLENNYLIKEIAQTF